MLTLTLVDMMVKNADPNFHAMLNNPKFFKNMRKIIDRGNEKGGRDNLEAQEKALMLIQDWGEAFLTRREQSTALFVKTYHELRMQGQRFPRNVDVNMKSPVFTPTASANASRGTKPTVNGNGGQRDGNAQAQMQATVAPNQGGGLDHSSQLFLRSRHHPPIFVPRHL